MIRDHGGPLFADLLRYYGVDLRAVCRGEGPPVRLVLALIEHLPADSAFAASASAERTRSEIQEWRSWQSALNTNLLLASLIDFQRENTKAQVGKKYRFQPMTRPGDKKKARVLTVAELNRSGGLRALPPPPSDDV